MNILEKVSEYIGKHQLIPNNEQKIIVGLSGGSDSIALLHILTALGYNCIAAHCNFHLRGEESIRDENFVKQICDKWNIELKIVGFDTSSYAAKEHISIEMAARSLRYNWFEKLSKELKISQIAIAHHLDDSVETVLLNLTRGTGIKGLTGISPRNGNIIRPLLCLKKTEVNQYIADKYLTFVQDSTNNSNVYQRNKLRLDVIPLFEEINPSFKESVAKMSRHLRQVETIYNRYMESEIKRVFEDNQISITKLLESHEPEALLFEILSPFGFNSEQIAQLFDSINRISGKTFLSTTHRVIKDRENIFVAKIETHNNYDIYEIEDGISNIDTPIKLTFTSSIRRPDTIIPKSDKIVSIDKSKIKFPLTIRHWQQGDSFIPFGMKGKKKLSDFFTDNKFSLMQKESVWILTSGKEIVWIIGHRADNRFRVENSTTEILKICIE